MPIRTEDTSGLTYQRYAGKCLWYFNGAENSAFPGRKAHLFVLNDMVEKFLFRVAKAFVLPGLGILLLPETAAPALLVPALHTHLLLSLRYPSGHQQRTSASVEEIARPDAPLTRALLLTVPDAQPVPAGTEVWWDGAPGMDEQ